MRHRNVAALAGLVVAALANAGCAMGPSVSGSFSVVLPDEHATARLTIDVANAKANNIVAVPTANLEATATGRGNRG